MASATRTRDHGEIRRWVEDRGSGGAVTRRKVRKSGRMVTMACREV